MSSTPYIKLMKSERRKERIFERVRRRARECFHHYALCGLVFGMINQQVAPNGATKPLAMLKL